MNTALNDIKNNVTNSFGQANVATKEALAAWEVTTNIYIAKLMAMGGYTRNDIFQNIITMFNSKQIVWDDSNPEHHAMLHEFLEALIATEVVQVAATIADNPFVVVGVDAATVTMTDMNLEANVINGTVPDSLVSILRALS